MLLTCTDTRYKIDKDYFFEHYHGDGKETENIRLLLWLIDNSDRVLRNDEAAYIMATVRHECGPDFNMERKEWLDAPWLRGRILWYAEGFDYPGDPAKGGKPHPKTGHLYFGRGPHQLTWYCNYKHQGEKMGLDLIGNPDLMLEPLNGFESMLNFFYDGDGTGGKYKMNQFFFADKSYAYFARKMINGLDHANLIEDYFQEFFGAIRYI